MKTNYIVGIMVLLCIVLQGQNIMAQGQINGRVMSAGEAVPYSTVSIRGTNIGTVSDENGDFVLKQLPVGSCVVVAHSVGFKNGEQQVVVTDTSDLRLVFDLEMDAMEMNEVVVSADRTEQKRSEAPVVVTSISPKLFTIAQAVTLSDGLNYAPGLRTENTCQNCGSLQVRMNGMEGPYSQILINSRPIFSGLAGVYGLELIPASMIERIEVVRGGGSALYGSNAIAGTINLILKDPTINSYEFGANTMLVGVGAVKKDAIAPDYSVNANASMVSDDRKMGFTVYGFNRSRKALDANGDGFSEVGELTNTTFGSRLYRRIGNKGKLSFDYFTIKEKRAGGNRFTDPLHERDIAEAVEHLMNTGAVTFERYCRELDLWSVYGSGQFLHRDSYYGAMHSLGDYGLTRDFTYNAGSQYKYHFKTSSVVTGIDVTGGYLKDEKLGYSNYAAAVIENNIIVSVPQTPNTVVSDQTTLTTGVYSQYELRLGGLKIVAGARADRYLIRDRQKTGNEKDGIELSPRLSLLYGLMDKLQTRVSYSHGYRAPQIYDEDLHVATSGARKVTIVNDVHLKQESSNSIMASVDYTRTLGKWWTSMLFEGFYTALNNPFMNVIGEPDSTGTVLYTRTNAGDGAVVRGINGELRIKTSNQIMINMGVTAQESYYKSVNNAFNEKRMFRTPNYYGFVAIDCDVFKRVCISTSGNYTGAMLIPYYGTQNPSGELHRTSPFFDWGLKVRYTLHLGGQDVQWYVGMKNVLNSYQRDFDSGVNRDPTYIYGPYLPRSLYFGLKIGNILD